MEREICGFRLGGDTQEFKVEFKVQTWGKTGLWSSAVRERQYAMTVRLMYRRSGTCTSCAKQKSENYIMAICPLTYSAHTCTSVIPVVAHQWLFFVPRVRCIGQGVTSEGQGLTGRAEAG